MGNGFVTYLHITVVCSALLLMDSSCATLSQPVRNSLAYFNTYYNAHRLMIDSEDEFFLYDEQNRITPRIVIIDQPTIIDEKPDDREVPQFIKSLIIKPEKLDRARLWIDSVLIKGSKILSRHAQSDFVDKTLFLMAKAYFYRSEWHNAQMKCQELIDTYPYSNLSPDAHLLLAKTLLMQVKFSQAEKALLRAIDIAWGQHRYDALSEAFRIQAEVALHFGHVEDAVKPYRRAIAQADDQMQRSRWQLEIGLLYYRKHEFQRAVVEFGNVMLYSTDPLTRYEAELYRAAALTQLRRYREAEEVFAELLTNRNYVEWRSFTYGEYIMLLNMMNKPGVDSIFSIMDTLSHKEPPAAARYRQALGLLRQGEYEGAHEIIIRSLVETLPVYFYSSLYARLLGEWKAEMPHVVNSVYFYQLLSADTVAYNSPMQDSARRVAAAAMYRLGRIHERLGSIDSAQRYYHAAARFCPHSDTNRARYLYAEATLRGLHHAGKSSQRGNSLVDSLESARSRFVDSVLRILALQYPTTQQGKDARVRLGYAEYRGSLDSIAEMMLSADRFRQTNQYAKALQKYRVIAERYAQSQYAPRACYAIGWLYEQELKKRDSAIYWYQHLVRKYPESAGAKDVQPALDAFLAEQRMRDSLKALHQASTMLSYSTIATLQIPRLSTNATITTASTRTSMPLQTDAMPRRRR
ncbi:MAG: tetratricopeptide repeat protein [Bacteroidota bacterium]|nr:tetratricopeptide repeat protein [Candidatus Kapabacteria bacterium]MDW8220044.1 tetratricopeptide repeat protein [Bacteroidota bacterium]